MKKQTKNLKMNATPKSCPICQIFVEFQGHIFNQHVDVGKKLLALSPLIPTEGGKKTKICALMVFQSLLA